ncbi:Dihydropteroate synthase [Sphingomonas laterariae]|uniref:dihydropteroate synthase n=1 Tax=Edaphosphingomonas laterariae TaxID=861865 RepID=A0A239HBI6_9SPHN|nr:dihydropteroate synthase [Sphingomonas laterariae]SNS78143.1 Dihydropteroate synthase [Sphingomonas laterariae]
MTQISLAARLYFRPTAFIAAPFDRDGQALRLAGGMLWFSAVDVIAIEGGRRVADQLVPVERLDALLATLSPAQAEAARGTIARLTAPRPHLQCGDRTIRLDQPQVMAILNMTPDSFSDGGAYVDDPASAADAGVAMAAAGAAIIDVGGESTRPGATTVWEGDEIARTVPVIERLARAGTAVSIDTRKAAVMEATLAAGAHIVNDVSALLWDERARAVVAAAGCPVVLMHHQGDPQTMQDDPRYGDALIEVYDWLEARIAAAEAAGIPRARIIVDPGIGFGKSVRHNLAILNGLALFHGLGCPVLLGASRKRLIGALADEAPADRRLPGSLALALAGANAGCQLIRVHDVAETVQALKVWRGMRDEALSPQ